MTDPTRKVASVGPPHRPSLAGQRQLKFSASHYGDKRRRNKSSVNPREIYAALQLNKAKGDADADHNARRSRSNIDAADVHAAEELRRLQQSLWRTDTRSRCNSLSSTGSGGSHTDRMQLAAQHQHQQAHHQHQQQLAQHQQHQQHQHQLVNPGVASSAEDPSAAEGNAAVDPAQPMSLAERAALAYPFPHRHRRKLPRTPAADHTPRQPQQQQRVVPTAPSSPPAELLPAYPSEPPGGGAGGGPMLTDLGDLGGGLGGYQDMHVRDRDDLDCRRDEPAPLRHEETSFEGVTLEHLRQLEELQIQRQMLQLAEAQLKASLGCAPTGCELPSYDQALAPPPPPPPAHSFGVTATAMTTQQQQRRRLPGYLGMMAVTAQQQARVDVANADDLSMLLKASC